MHPASFPSSPIYFNIPHKNKTFFKDKERVKAFFSAFAKTAFTLCIALAWKSTRNQWAFALKKRKITVIPIIDGEPHFSSSASSSSSFRNSSNSRNSSYTSNPSSFQGDFDHASSSHDTNGGTITPFDSQGMQHWPGPKSSAGSEKGMPFTPVGSQLGMQHYPSPKSADKSPVGSLFTQTGNQEGLQPYQSFDDAAPKETNAGTLTPLPDNHHSSSGASSTEGSSSSTASGSFPLNGQEDLSLADASNQPYSVIGTSYSQWQTVNFGQSTTPASTQFSLSFHHSIIKPVSHDTSEEVLSNPPSDKVNVPSSDGSQSAASSDEKTGAVPDRKTDSADEKVDDEQSAEVGVKRGGNHNDSADGINPEAPVKAEESQEMLKAARSALKGKAKLSSEETPDIEDALSPEEYALAEKDVSGTKSLKRLGANNIEREELKKAVKKAHKLAKAALDNNQNVDSLRSEIARKNPSDDPAAIQAKLEEKVFKLALKSILLLKQTKLRYTSCPGEYFFKINPDRQTVDGKRPAYTRLFGDNVWAHKTPDGKVAFYAFQKQLGKGSFNTGLLTLKILKADYRVYRKSNLSQRQIQYPTQYDASLIRSLREENQLHLALQKNEILRKGMVRMYREIITPYEMGSFLEYGSKGELRAFLNMPGNKNRKRVLCTIFETIAELHKLGYYHGDLKPENILLTTNEAGELEAKVADFGAARKQNSRNVPLGTIRYMPPEGLSPNSARYSKEDSWALGLIMYQIKYGYLPAFAYEQEDIYMKNLNNIQSMHAQTVLQRTIIEGRRRLQLDTNDPYDQVIDGLLNLNPSVRFSVEEAYARMDKIPSRHFAFNFGHYYQEESFDGAWPKINNLVNSGRMLRYVNVGALTRDASGKHFFVYASYNNVHNRMAAAYVPCHVAEDGIAYMQGGDPLDYETLRKNNYIPLSSY